MRRTCHTRHVPPRTTHHSIPPTRLLAIPQSQLPLAHMASQSSSLRSIHQKLPYPQSHSPTRKNNLHIYPMGYNPTLCLYCQSNLAKNPTHFHRTLRNNSPSFVQNAPKIAKPHTLNKYKTHHFLQKHNKKLLNIAPTTNFSLYTSITYKKL